MSQNKTLEKNRNTVVFCLHLDNFRWLLTYIKHNTVNTILLYKLDQQRMMITLIFFWCNKLNRVHIKEASEQTFQLVTKWIFMAINKYRVYSYWA